MLSFLLNVFDSLDAEKQKRKLQEKFQEEQNYLDDDFKEEDVEGNLTPTSRMLNVKTENNQNDAETDSNTTTEKSACSKRLGVITSLKSNHGTIDHAIFFDINVALAVASDLKVGCRIEYLAFQQEDSEHIKVIKIEQVIDNFWDEELPTDKKIEQQIEELKKEKPKYFNTHQRNILGLIIERKPKSIIIDTDYKSMNISLDTVEIDFIPKEGDRVFVCCNVQSDEHFVDKQGEILQEVSVHPARMLKQEKCTVKRLHSDWGVLNDDCYFTFDVLSAACKLSVDDVVCADLIECDRGKYIWRCIKLTVLERAYQPAPAVITPLTSSNEPVKTHGRNAVTVSEDQRCIFTEIFDTKQVEILVVNNLERTLKCNNIEFLKRLRDSQLRLIQPDPGNGFEVPAGGEYKIVFEVESKFYGKSREIFVIRFESFKVKRSITIIVCENEAAAEAAAKEDIRSQPAILMGGRNSSTRSRHYANQVWSKRGEIIPGVGLVTKRRFVALRIGHYEVPERLRSAYLTSENRQAMLDNIESMFPSLKDDLKISNYVTRFQTLIFLEEIEYFVNFRNYDRERAHFTRDGEFLALIVENLAERRPSLVIGDVVRAINPWGNSDDNNRSYDGVIHKVLFDRVLLKFNAGFQNKYNGEDYRLEFYFSRFAFRKQHFSINRIVQTLGEPFLFPTRVHTNESVQLDIDLNKDGNLQMRGEICPWFNTSLNSVQKQAVRNILRGEAKNMVYVVFGPPGTGKTITLVETILQLVKHLPSARLLVGTPSNSSADLITTRLIESKGLKPGDFVRLVSQNQVEKDLIPEHLMAYCATVDIAADGTCDDSMIVTETGLKLRCQMKYLGRHRVTISTCTTLGNFLQMGFPPGHFSHVLVDESGQCTEPETMIAISQLSKTRCQVILAGDPNQLQAIVINRYAADRGFSTSFLERILTRAPYLKDNIRFPDTSGFDPRLVTKLLYNYRSLPSILNVYNELFYDSELLAMVDEGNSREANLLDDLQQVVSEVGARPKTHGTFFFGVFSENMQEKDSPSWYNPGEAKNVFIMTLQFYRHGVKPESIGIITPYMKQVKQLRSLFITADIAMPKIGSVEEFQGQERDIILITTVRSTSKQLNSDLRHSLGFVQCAKRMNVAISRARAVLCVFGNPHLLALDHCWRTYIKYCVDNDAYLGAELPDCILDDDDTQTIDITKEE